VEALQQGCQKDNFTCKNTRLKGTKGLHWDWHTAGAVGPDANLTGACNFNAASDRGGQSENKLQLLQ